MGLDIKQAVAAGVGAGSTGVIVELLKGFTPIKGVTPDLLTAGIGYVMADRMTGMGQDFGMGVLIGAIGELTREPIEGIVAKVKSPKAATNNPSNHVAAIPAGDEVELYMLRRYGLN